MKVMYIRVSTNEQNPDLQIRKAEELGIEKLFIEKVSGKDTNRKQLHAMLDFVREGDEVVVYDISRLARNTRDLLSIIDTLKEKKVEFKSIREQIDTTTIQGKFMLSVFSALAELERENLLERQRAGIMVAKEQGKYKGRKPIEIDKLEFERYCKDWRNGKRTAVSIMKHFNISSPTFYRKVKEFNL